MNESAPEQVKTILIVEDEMLIALDIHGILEEAGHNDLVIHNSLGAALGFLEKATPRMAILDVNLGGGEKSFSVGQELAARGCPFMLLTGYSGTTVELPDDLSKTPRLPKPFAPNDLRDTVAKLLAA